ncbi:22885_t:CDS:2, partial [Gigaspora margarita]
MIKKYLQVSTGNLHAVHQKLFLALENQYREVQTMVSQEKIQIPHILNNQFYAQVVNKVSVFALKKTYEQFLKATDSTLETPLPSCSNTFTLSMGLPCSHRLQNQSSTHVLSEPKNFLQQQWQEYDQQFNSWSSFRQAIALNQVSNLFLEPTIVLQNPQ